MEDDGTKVSGEYISAKFDMAGLSWQEYLKKSIAYTESESLHLSTEKPRARTALLRLLSKDMPDTHPYHSLRYTRTPIRPIGKNMDGVPDQSETKK